MFQALHNKLDSALKALRGRSTLSQKDIDDTIKAVRMALLEADVNFQIARDFCASVASKASLEQLSKSLSPDQQVIKLVHDELIALMGTGAEPLNLGVKPPAVIMLVGLQGSGKTTTAGKLAQYIKKELKRSPVLVPADVYRPAAIEQLKSLGARGGIPVYPSSADQDPVQIAKGAVSAALLGGHDTVIIDTAGRLQIDSELMRELQEICDAVEPHEILLVADAMTGQEAVNVAKGFDEALEIDGIILTKLDGDTRGGAALSMKAITKRPIKFIGLGEKADALEVFHPERMASRILGMGDVMSLIEKASKEFSAKDSEKLANKFKKNEFSLEDFLDQMRMMKRMGSISSIAGMIPGMGKVMEKVNQEDLDKEMKRTESIILSMTPEERRNHQILNGSRRKRIAMGSGTSPEAVNRLIKQFSEMKAMMTQLTKGGLGGLLKGLGGLGGTGGLGGLKGLGGFPKR